ncbi:uncharacterized protein M6B38_199295 [Iris pallida]|uniref:DUF4283 domain-containing protein n=1 Tax=Iris pallida TaxID=29817 RepID=A0AAX6EAM0_IRIPA|nr:uncharacterized protein M6B38_199295 [Iris pallida]
MRPLIAVVRQTFAGFGLADACRIGVVDPKHILIIPWLEADFLRLQSRVQWIVAKSPMRIFQWSIDFDPQIESAVATVWVNLPGIRHHLFEKSALFRLAKPFGVPLKLDIYSSNVDPTRPSMVRIFMEVDLNHPLPSRVRVNLPNHQSYWQPIINEDPPLYCKNCRHLGHEISKYKAKNSSSTHEAGLTEATSSLDTIPQPTIPQTKPSLSLYKVHPPANSSHSLLKSKRQCHLPKSSTPLGGPNP